MSVSEAVQGSSLEFKLPVPFVSQRLKVPPWNEPHRACGMVCAYMALKYYEENELTGEAIPDLDLLIADGRDEGGLLPGVGWIHDYLVNTFRKFGVDCTREEEMDPATSMDRFADYLERCKDPVLISTRNVRPDLDGRSTHLLLLTGTRRSPERELVGFFLHDPNVNKEEEGEHMFMAVDDLSQVWRRMAILPCTKM